MQDMKATEAYALAKAYVNDTAEELGAVKGAPCQIKSITRDAENHRNIVVFEWIDKSEVSHTDTAYLYDGEQGEPGPQGEEGYTPTITVKSSTLDEYILTITNEEGSFDTPNLKGTAGGASELDDLNDIDFNNLEDGQVLVYDAETGKWTNGEGSGGSGELQNDLEATVAVGGVTVGTEFESGTPIETVVRRMLAPTIYPVLTAPSASLTYSSDTYYAVGSTVAAKAATVSFNAGAITLNGVKQNNRAGAATGYALASSGADTEYSATSESSGSFNVSALTRSTKGSIVLTGTVSYGAGPQPKDSDGNDYDSPLPAGSVTASKTLQFIQPYYYGASNSASISDFTGLTENVSAKGQKTFKFTTNNQYMVFAYDSSYGNLSSILDSNGFETISGWNSSTITVDGFTYKVYVSASPTTDTNAAFTFKY